MIRLENVTKKYGSTTVLNDLNFACETGKITALIGPSGCGKTTTLKLLNRLEDATKGEIYIDETEVSNVDPVILRRSIGYVIQSIGLFPNMTISENIAVVPKLLKWSKQRTDTRVTELLSLVGLDPAVYKGRSPSELSGGQQQRIGVARALAAEPPVILMDEPFSALDPISREQLQDELVRLQKDTESQVMGYLYEAVIEAQTDIEVEVKTGLPSTAVIVSAMEADEGQLATMYTGEITNGYFPFDTGDNSPEHYMSEAQKGFKEHYNFTWYDALGFENQYAFAVSKDYAEEHGLKTLSDLHKVADSATVRVETQWLERDDDGYTGFQDTYGFEFADVKPMEVSLIYKAIDEDKVDVGLVYTTDAGISLYDLVVLEDDMQFFPPYLAASVIKNETLEQYPEVGDVLQRLEGSLSEEIMRELNGAVSLEGKKPKEAVEDYLAEHELLR